MPNNWKTYKLEEISTDVSYGYTESASWDEIGPKFLRITDIQNDFIDWNTVPYCKISEKDLQKNKLVTGDIVIARTGNSTGATICIKDSINAVFASYLIRFRLNKQIANPFFIDYILRSVNWKNYVDAIKGGSAQPGANAKQFGAFELKLPPLPEQKSIANILSAIDDKIENNLAINKTLEDMAMALYKHWFVDFGPFQEGAFVESELGLIPEGWEVKPISDVFEVRDGTHDSPKRKEEGYYLITSKHLKGNQIDYSSAYKISKEDFDKVNNRSLVEKGDILMTMIGTVGNFFFVNHKPDYAIKNIGLFKTSRVPNLQNYLYSFFKSKICQDYIKGQMSGSTQQYITLRTLRNFPVIFPENTVIKDYTDMVKSNFNKIDLNIKENQTLTQLRDTLLPKLISGEVRLKEFQNQIQAVL